jgi:hypothetical protein
MYLYIGLCRVSAAHESEISDAVVSSRWLTL